MGCHYAAIVMGRYGMKMNNQLAFAVLERDSFRRIAAAEFDIDEFEAIETAKAALEKQIPKEPHMNHCQCGEAIDINWIYCPDCGQRVR